MKKRQDLQANYRAFFFNGKTVRQRIDPSKSITAPLYPEIEDVAINAKCFAACSYCYTSAVKEGENFQDIEIKSQRIWGSLPIEERPFQIAIGGAGEPTLHPSFTSFLSHVRGLGITPNYTTNGMHLNQEILEATNKYCGGLAISWHPHIEPVFHRALNVLKGATFKVNTHFIIGEHGSLDKLKVLFEQYKYQLDYFVILPYQAVGRAVPVQTEIEWLDTFQWISELEKEEQAKFAFGALFYEWMKDLNLPLEIDMYEPEIYSGYRMMDNNYQTLYKSSYDLTPKII